MPTLDRLRIRRKQIGSKPSTRLIQVRVNEEWFSSFKDVRDSLRSLTRQRLTCSYVLREGGIMMLRHLRVQIAKAEKGELHAKKRKH